MKWPLKKTKNCGFQDQFISLNADLKYFRLSLIYHLSPRSLFLSIFERLFYTGFYCTLFFSPDLIKTVATAISIEVRARNNDFVRRKVFSSHTGLNCFSPVINIMRHPLWGRNQVSFYFCNTVKPL